MERPCANHDERPAVFLCRRCDHPFCDACGVFRVNDDVWCEPCGVGFEDEARSRRVRAAIVLAGGWAFVTFAWLARVLLVPFRIPYFLTTIFLGYAAFLSWAWNIVSPTLGREAPTFERRAPGSPPPRNARRS